MTRKVFLWIVAFILVRSIIAAQVQRPTATITYPGAPTGTCIDNVFAINGTTHDLYYCRNGTWTITSITINGTSTALGSSRSLVLNSSDFANEGTTTTVLHGAAAGNPSFGAVVSGDLNITTTSCTNQLVSAISSGGVGTCSSVSNAMLSNSTITLNAGTNVGLTAPGAMSLGSTYTIGATSDKPQFAALGLGAAAGSTYMLNIAPTSGASAGNTVFIQDATASTGKTQVVIKAGAGNSGNDGLLLVNSTSGTLYTFRLSGLLVNNGIQTDSSHSAALNGTGTAQSKLQFGADGLIVWSNGTAYFQGSVDTGIYRNAGGIVEINNGTAGTFRDIAVRNALIEGTTSGTITVAGGATPTSYTLTLPSSGGTANYAMTTDGSGTASWVSGQSIAGLTTSDTPQFTRQGLGVAADSAIALDAKSGSTVNGAIRAENPFSTDGNTTRTVLALLRTYSGGVGANNIGGRIRFANEGTTEGTVENTVFLDGILTDATAGAAKGQFEISTNNAGTMTTQFQITSTGGIFMPNLTTSTSSSLHDLCIDNTTKEVLNDSNLCIVSSKRFKHDIENIDVGLDFIKRLRPVEYTLNDDPTNERKAGLIAEEVEALDKRFVTYEKDGRVRSVKYIELIPALIKAVQQLDAERRTK